MAWIIVIAAVAIIVIINAVVIMTIIIIIIAAAAAIIVVWRKVIPLVISIARFFEKILILVLAIRWFGWFLRRGMVLIVGFLHIMFRFLFYRGGGFFFSSVICCKN